MTTCRQHRTEAADDYTELIADLLEEQGDARVGIIAAHLGISHVTVSRSPNLIGGTPFWSTRKRQ